MKIVNLSSCCTANGVPDICLGLCIVDYKGGKKLAGQDIKDTGICKNHAEVINKCQKKGTLFNDDQKGHVILTRVIISSINCLNYILLHILQDFLLQGIGVQIFKEEKAYIPAGRYAKSLVILCVLEN